MGHAVRALLAFAAVASALNPVEVQRQDFVDSGTGKRFEIIGVVCSANALLNEMPLYA